MPYYPTLASRAESMEREDAVECRIRFAPRTHTPEDHSPDSSTRFASETTSDTRVSLDEVEPMLFSALCMYSFHSSDPAHLPFRQNEILHIIVQEDSGWWAAHRPENSQSVGWIPGSFVQRLPLSLALKLESIPERQRMAEYELHVNNDHDHETYGKQVDETDQVLKNLLQPLSVNREPQTFHPPPNHVTPAPEAPPGRSSFIHTPRFIFPSSRHSLPHTDQSRATTGAPVAPRSRRITVDSMARLLRRKDGKDSPKSPMSPSDDTSLTQTFSDRGRYRTLPGATISRGRSDLPWFARPRYDETVLVQHPQNRMVLSGTLEALIEKLIELPEAASTQDDDEEAANTASRKLYRDTFLMTFRTFVSADDFFNLLTSRYEDDPSDSLAEADFNLWRNSYMLPQQLQILDIFRRWSTCHDMLLEEPHIVPKLLNFLALIPTTGPLASTAKQLLNSIHALVRSHYTFQLTALILDQQELMAPHAYIRSRTLTDGKSKIRLLQVDPGDLAEQLFLYEHRLYSKIKPQECLNWGKTQTGHSVINMIVFCATHDRLVAWVQLSVLQVLGQCKKRAKMIDFWIKVAEKCRAINNFSSTSAIVTALTSAALKRLSLTCAHVDRSEQLDALAVLNDAAGNFSSYRAAMDGIGGACIPFMAMYLTDLVRIQQQPDMVSDSAMINYSKRIRFFNTVTSMLRFQTKTFSISERAAVMSLVHSEMAANADKDQDWIWTCSQAVQAEEVAEADNFLNLAKAGFHEPDSAS